MEEFKWWLTPTRTVILSLEEKEISLGWYNEVQSYLKESEKQKLKKFLKRSSHHRKDIIEILKKANPFPHYIAAKGINKPNKKTKNYIWREAGAQIIVF